MKEIERGKLEKFGKWRNHSNDENLPVYLSSMVRENVFYRKWYSWFHFLRDIVLWSHDSHIFVTSRYVCEYWNEAHFSTPRMNDPTRNRVARLISTRIIMHNLIFWNYIRFDKVRDLKYIFKRELITFQFIEHIIIKSCNVTLPNVSLIKATWQ